MTFPPPFPRPEERHAASMAAFQARDLERYMRPFAESLRYRQANGKVITRATLLLQVLEQLRSVSRAEWSWEVTATDTQPGQVIETGNQRGWVATQAFGILHRLWRLERTARHTWRVEGDIWQIVEVDVLSEQVSGAGIQFGLKPRLPDLSGP